MAVMHLSDAYVEINSVDLSDHVKSVELGYEGEALDDTVMGDDTRSNLAGLKNWTLSVTFAQDYAASKVDATLFSLVGAAAFPVIVRPDNSDGSGATNPNFTGTAILQSYPALAGAVGDFHESAVTFSPAGTLTRVTTTSA